MTNQSILLINPPVSKPCEPPAGLAKLAWSLRSRGIDCRVYDAGVDALLNLLDRPLAADDTWTRRALAHRDDHLDGLRSMALYRQRDRYRRAVKDINRLLQKAALPADIALSLTNYTSATLSPVRSADLIQAAETWDANPFHTIFAPSLTERLTQNEPHIIGISINFMSQALCAFAMIGWLRRRLPHATIVCGGGLVSSWMAIPGWGNPFAGLVDEMVCGPGERRLFERCTGGTGDPPSVTGYDYSALNLDRYLAPRRILPYSASRGCYWKKCAFCPETAEDAPYLTAAPEAVVNDVRQSLDRTSAGLIHFLDNALSPRLLAYLADHPPGAPWYGFVRLSRQLTDRDFVRKLSASGCVMLKLGLESGDQSVLDALEKGIDIAMAAKALDTIHRAGIATYVYLLFGTPAENQRSAMRTMTFTMDHAPSIDFLNLAIFNLPAHSDQSRDLATVDFYAGDLSLYREFVHPQGWNRDRVRRFLTGTFKKQRAIRAIIHADPPFFTSNHAPFFRLNR